MTIKTGLLVAAIAMGAGVTYAQQKEQQSGSERRTEGSQADSQSQSERSQSDLKVTEEELSQRVSDVNKAGKLIGMQVKNTKNENVGKIKDLAIDLESGRVSYAVLSAGGFLGVRDKLIAVPLQALTVEKGAKNLLLDVDKKTIEQAAGFSDDSWPNLNAAEKGQTIGLAVQKGGSATNATGRPDADQVISKGPVESRKSAQGAPGQEAKQARGTSGAITSVQPLTAKTDTENLEGKQVELKGAKVHEVTGTHLVSVMSDQGQPVYFRAEGGLEQIKAGQTVDIKGKVRKTPSESTQLGLDDTAAQKLQGQVIYVEVEEIKPANQ